MRYGIALLVALAFIGAGACFVWATNRSVEALFRQIVQEAQARGQLPAEIDPEQASVWDFGVDLSRSPGLLLRIKISHLLQAQRFILIGMILVVSLGIAYATRPKKAGNKAEPPVQTEAP